MKKVNVINIKTNQVYGGQYENPTEWINNCIINNYWGLPERWVQAKELMENGNTNEPEHWMWHSEYYEDSDVIQTEERNITYITNEVNELGHTVEVEKTKKENWVLLKADYTIEIIDLEQDYNWLLSECYRKRKEEYPKMEDYLDGVVKNDEEQKREYIDKCLEVKRKYPKPIRSN